MKRLTLREVNERYGGVLPPDAILRPDDAEVTVEVTPVQRPTSTNKPKRRTRADRFSLLNAFVDMGMADLSVAETKTWLILFRDTKATGTARTGQTDIARRAGLSVRSVKNALRSLTAKGMVRVVRRGRLNGGPSVYSVHPTGSHGEA